jgi:hypothetical protein
MFGKAACDMQTNKKWDAATSACINKV